MRWIFIINICVLFTSVNGEAENFVEINSSSCSTEEDCGINLAENHEKVKYSSENDHSVLHPGDAKVEDIGNSIENRQYKPNLPNEMVSESDKRNDEYFEQLVTQENSQTPSQDASALPEFPPLTRLDPVKVGYEVEVELEEGKFYKRITKAIHPPVFEVQDFLSAEECQQLINVAGELGLQTSGLFGADVEEELNNTDPSEIARISDQTWLHRHYLPELWSTLMKRLSVAIQMPVEFLYRSEPMQLVKYKPGGHYHAHSDTTETKDDETAGLPCCIQTHCGDKELTPRWSECCRLCRYITVMYYLSEVEEGGETAFPLADINEDLLKEKTSLPDQQWFNLSKYCYNSSLIVTPRKGSAIIWYNHFRDEQTGYLGLSDKRSYHGGCDLIKGTKWIANNFISASAYKDRYKPSLWYRGAS